MAQVFGGREVITEEGIHCSCIGADTLDEAPFAYRSIGQIMKNIEETVQVTNVLKPREGIGGEYDCTD